MEVKARKVGNSITLTVPKSFFIEEGQSFEVTKSKDGGIHYHPKRRNIFEGDWFNEDLRQTDIFLEDEVLDSEW